MKIKEAQCLLAVPFLWSGAPFLWSGARPQVSCSDKTDNGNKHHLGLQQRTENFHGPRTMIWTIMYLGDYDYLYLKVKGRFIDFVSPADATQF